MFVSFVLLVVESALSASANVSPIMGPVRDSRFGNFATSRLSENGHKSLTASISDATTQMDHNTVVLFTIDRLARSPRATVRTRGTGKAPDRWFVQ